MMTPFECYEIYVAVHAHFTSDTFDVSKSGFKTRASNSSFMRRKDAAHFYRAAKIYRTKRQWTEALIACYLQDRTYIVDILGADAADNISEYDTRIQNMRVRYRADLTSLLDESTRLDCIFIQNYDGSEPVIVSKILTGDVSLESAVIMNSIFRWIDRARTSDTLLWPEYRKKLLKYQPLLRYDTYKYKDLTEKILKSYV